VNHSVELLGCHQGGQSFRLEQIQAVELRPIDVMLMAARQVVYHRDVVATLSKEVNSVRSDVPGPPVTRIFVICPS
jgi:hypothetical protein